MADRQLLTIDEISQDSESDLLLGALSDVESQRRLCIAIDLVDLPDDVEDSLALLVLDLEVGTVNVGLACQLDLRGLEPADETAAPKSTSVAFDGIVRVLESGTEGNEVLVVELLSDFLADLYDEEVSDWSIFRLRLSRSVQVYREETQTKCRRVAIWGTVDIPRSGA